MSTKPTKNFNNNVYQYSCKGYEIRNKSTSVEFFFYNNYLLNCESFKSLASDVPIHYMYRDKMSMHMLKCIINQI